LGKTDEDGFIYVVGRVNELIKTSGHRVSAKEVEEAISRMDDVLEVAVKGVEDRILGEAIKAYIVPRDRALFSEEALGRHLRGRLPDYKLPHAVELRDELPKNEFGKVIKRLL
jgi:long-chain acyl-CoA synthetase